MAKKKNVTVTIKDELKQELKKFAQQVGVGAASYARDALTDAAYDAFERFYCDYTPIPGGPRTSYKFKFHRPQGNPKVYERTYNVLQNGISKFYENKHGKIIRGGVELSPEDMEEVYEISATQVFENIYEHGYHGLAPTRSAIVNGRLTVTYEDYMMRPTPQELIQQAYDNLISDNQAFTDAGFNRAAKNSYSYFSLL